MSNGEQYRVEGSGEQGWRLAGPALGRGDGYQGDEARARLQDLATLLNAAYRAGWEAATGAGGATQRQRPATGGKIPTG